MKSTRTLSSIIDTYGVDIFRSSHADIIKNKATIIRNPSTGKLSWAVDINPYGFWSPLSDPENITLYRDTLMELIEDTYDNLEEDEDN